MSSPGMERKSPAFKRGGGPAFTWAGLAVGKSLARRPSHGSYVLFTPVQWADLWNLSSPRHLLSLPLTTNSASGLGHGVGGGHLGPVDDQTASGCGHHVPPVGGVNAALPESACARLFLGRRGNFIDGWVQPRRSSAQGQHTSLDACQARVQKECLADSSRQTVPFSLTASSPRSSVPAPARIPGCCW